MSSTKAPHALVPNSRTASYKNTLVWAEDGMCHVVNKVTGELENSYNCVRFRHRLQALRELLGFRTQEENLVDLAGAVDRRQLMRFIEDCEAVMKIAILQGEPGNPDTPAFRKAAAPKALFIPGMPGTRREGRPEPHTPTIPAAERRARTDRRRSAAEAYRKISEAKPFDGKHL